MVILIDMGLDNLLRKNYSIHTYELLQLNRLKNLMNIYVRISPIYTRIFDYLNVPD